jgi:hypothetical protein
MLLARTGMLAVRASRAGTAHKAAQAPMAVPVTSGR